MYLFCLTGDVGGKGTGGVSVLHILFKQTLHLTGQLRYVRSRGLLYLLLLQIYFRCSFSRSPAAQPSPGGRRGRFTINPVLRIAEVVP